MDGMTISLTEAGSFELTDGPFTVSVTFDEALSPRPWVLSSLLDDNCRMSSFDAEGSFASLDEALAEMMNLMADGEEWSTFRVKLPCESTFIRPGKVSAENVLASFGWVHVKTLIGHLVRAFPSVLGASEVIEMVSAEIADANIEIGTPSAAGGYGDDAFWCIDLRRDCNSFIRYDAIQSAVSDAFGGILGGSPPLYDFVTTYPIREATAQIVSFPERARFAA